MRAVSFSWWKAFGNLFRGDADAVSHHASQPLADRDVGEYLALELDDGSAKLLPDESLVGPRSHELAVREQHVRELLSQPASQLFLSRHQVELFGLRE